MKAFLPALLAILGSFASLSAAISSASSTSPWASRAVASPMSP